MHTTFRRRRRGTDYAAAPRFLAVTFGTLQAIGLTLLLALTPGSAFAQSTYVGAAVVGDVLRSTHSESALAPKCPGRWRSHRIRAACGNAARQPMGRRARIHPAGRNRNGVQRRDPVGEQYRGLIASPTRVVPGGITLPHMFPSPLPYRLRSTQRHSTLSTTVWFNQSLSPKSLAGLSCGDGLPSDHVRKRVPFRDSAARITLPAGFPSVTTKTITYGVRPLAGFEARIRPDRPRRPRARNPAARARECLAAASGRGPGVELLSDRGGSKTRRYYSRSR